tara:strand:- start:1803 stop:2000 length:198 start_codon:yes stop_codon:yes gene_type:complete
MSKYKAIVEQLRVEAGGKYKGEIESSLRQIERRGDQDNFTDTYIKLQRAGFHPYDCLVGYMKGER